MLKSCQNRTTVGKMLSGLNIILIIKDETVSSLNRNMSQQSDRLELKLCAPWRVTSLFIVRLWLNILLIAECEERSIELKFWKWFPFSWEEFSVACFGGIWFLPLIKWHVAFHKDNRSYVKLKILCHLVNCMEMIRKWYGNDLERTPIGASGNFTSLCFS
jgi:hypothetical protein